MQKLITLPIFLGTSLSLVANEKPNIIIVYVDDMAYADVSCYGGNFVETKNIDKLAKEGIRFTQYYTSAPISSPSRVALTTGMYPTRWGIRTFLHTKEHNKRNNQNDFLSDKAPSIATVLKQNGYATSHFGKWHMGGGRDVDNAPSIYKYGFDEYVSTWESPDPDKLITSTDWIWSNQDSIKRWNRTAYYVDKTLDFIKRNGSKPCFVNLWPDDVHTPFVPNPNDMLTKKADWEKREAFKFVLKDFDVQIGRLMEGLQALGVDNNTMVIFTSDNGPNPEYGVERTGGLRGKKGTLYDGGIRLPFIVRWPAKIAPNQLNDKSLIAAVDMLPTLCKITDSSLDTKFKLDGEDRSDVIVKNKNSKRNKPLFWEFTRNNQGIKDNNGNFVSQIAVREEKWKYLVYSNGEGAELYDLIADPGENYNLVGKYPKIDKDLKDKAMKWFEKAFREFADR